jgi:hypothetical protein
VPNLRGRLPSTGFDSYKLEIDRPVDSLRVGPEEGNLQIPSAEGEATAYLEGRELERI